MLTLSYDVAVTSFK